ncbi:MAG: adenylate/guanylate cyclase domain-containing protein [Treponema sp.]|jgi:adenylate cyclase|nr:adenylate/guanylate cyclase domain-containing protein [Treponema sp.]
MKTLKKGIVGLAAAAVFSLLYITGGLDYIEERFYDLFLRFRVERPRVDNIVIAEADDPAIDYLGVWPWPRYGTADSLFRLTEYSPSNIIFDWLFLDPGAMGVDFQYLEHGLDRDFEHSLNRIHTAINNNERNLSSVIRNEYADLQTKAHGILRNNDQYFSEVIALNGNVWTTMYLESEPLEGDWAERRPFAEKHFSYPVTAAQNAHIGAGYVDVLSNLPLFAEGAKGAGVCNYDIDKDGIMRRIYLTNKVGNHWYIQLGFAPLMNSLGRPEILLEKRKLTIKQAKMPNGRVKDIDIPLDHEGKMLIDWPKTSYKDSFPRLSLLDVLQLGGIETELEDDARALAAALAPFATKFPAQSEHFAGIPALLSESLAAFDSAKESKTLALQQVSKAHFGNFTAHRNYALSLLGEIVSRSSNITLPADAAPLIAKIKENLELRHELDAKIERMVRNKLCIMTTQIIGNTEYGPTPFDGTFSFGGVPAVVIDTILSESFITPVGVWWRVVFMMLFIPLFLALTSALVPVRRGILGFSAALFIAVIAVFLFRFSGVFWGPAGFLSAMILAVVIREIMSYATSEKEKHFIRNAFSTYVSNDIVKELIADPSRLQLGGAKRHMTAIFTDVQGFSSISEQLAPENLVSLLNRYLSAMSDIILDEKGTIDKYEGDAIVAFFGAPLDLPDHALRACMSAIKIKKIEVELNKSIIKQNLSPIPLLTRIGINTGDMVAGNMGTANKMNFTIMGHMVNLAARLEGVNKQYVTWILASEDTVRETGNKLLWRKLDRVRVVGINEPVRIYELLDTAADAGEQDKKLAALFDGALDNFEKRNWKQAADGFVKVIEIKADDYPAKLYIERCAQFVNAPPEPDWDGVYNLTSK